MVQKLILPINKARLTASWKTDAYKTRFGYEHYGVDMVSSVGTTLLYASGIGKVIATGYDTVLGNFLVIQYTDAYNHVIKKSCDVICRMWHMAQVSVRKGASVNKDTIIGYYGNTGQYTTGAHLHLEMDTDIKYPMYTPTLSGKTSNFIGRSYGANDKTMSNPLSWLHAKTSTPDKQAYTTAGNAFIRSEDISIPTIQ